MRRVVKPLEALLTVHKRIVLKDSAVSSDSSHLSVCVTVTLLPGECSLLWSQGSVAWCSEV